MSETLKDQLGRVRSMAHPDQATWDLSEKDQAALRAVLEHVDALTKERDDLQRKLSVAREALDQSANYIADHAPDFCDCDDSGPCNMHTAIEAVGVIKHALAAIEESRPPSAALSGDLGEDVATAGGGHQPLPPDVLANALQDPIHASSRSLIDAKPVDAAHQPKAISEERPWFGLPVVKGYLDELDRLRAEVERLRGAADKQLAFIRDVAAGALDHVCDKGEEVEFWRATANVIANLADGLDDALAGGEK